MLDHPGDTELDQITAVDELTRGAADGTRRRSSRLEVLAHDDGEVVLAGMIDDAVAVVEAFHDPQLRPSCPDHHAMTADPSLVGDRRQVLGVVQRRHRVEIGAEPEDPAGGTDEAFEGRVRSVVVVPWNVLHEPVGERSRGAEPSFGVVADRGRGSRTEDLGQDADLRIRRGHEAVERFSISQQAGPVALWSFVDPSPVVAGPHRHEQRPARSDRQVECVDDTVGTTEDRSDGAQRRVDHQQIAFEDTEPAQVGNELLDRPARRIHSDSLSAVVRTRRTGHDAPAIVRGVAVPARSSLVPSDVMNLETLVAETDAALRSHGAPERAVHEQAYLKSELEHYGVSVPSVRAVARSVRRDHPDLGRDELVALVDALWAAPVHERRMVVVELLDLYADRLLPADMELLERLLRESRTWALVDGLAASVVGGVVERYPETTAVLDRWAGDDDFWIRRSALLALLIPLRRGGGDFDRFTRYADAMLEEKEFFIRKAIGWVLRDTARKRPTMVYDWLLPRAARASGVTLREAVKPMSAEQRAAILSA